MKTKKQNHSQSVTNNQNETGYLPIPDQTIDRVWEVLWALENERIIGDIGETVSISLAGGIVTTEEVTFYTRKNDDVLSKLSILEAITDVQFCGEKFPYYWTCRIGPKYIQTYEKYRLAHNAIIRQRNQDRQDNLLDKITLEIPEADDDIVYTVSYSNITRKIKVNGFLIANLNFDSDNEIIFDYLYQHPNTKVSRKDIEAKSKRSIKKTMHKFVENIGFSGDLRRVFFEVSVDTIKLRNPVTRTMLKQIGIEELKLTP